MEYRHIARHKIKPEEIREVFENEILEFSAKKGRLMIIGRTHTERIVSIIIDRKAGSKYYLVTARDSGKKEKKLYKEKI